MAKDNDLFDKLRARGLRKSVANNLAKAFGRGDSPPKGARRAVSELRSLVDEFLEHRARGGPAKRKAAAKKAAATRRRKARERSAAAKKAARTRTRSTRPRGRAKK